MHIVYLLVHKIRLQEDNVPYYYIGSKWNWKGEKTYFSSSRHEIVKEGYEDDLFITPLWSSNNCTKEELLNKEQEFQVAHDVINNPKFFNRNIANTKIYQTQNLDKRIESFKKKAWSISEDGRYYKDIWAERAVQVKLSKFSKEYLSEYGKLNMAKITDSGKTVCEIVHEGMMKTMSIVGEDGLTGFQRAGKRLSEVLNKVDDSTGMTIAEKLRYFGNTSTRFELFNFTFFTKSSATRLLGVDVTVLDNLQKGYCSSVTYKKLLDVFEEDVICHLRIRNPGSDPFMICGEEFFSFEEVRSKLKVTQWATDQFSKTGKPNKKMKTAMINYFGKDEYYKYYPEN